MTKLENTADASGSIYVLEPATPGIDSFTFTEYIRRGAAGAQPGYPGSPPEHIHFRQVETFKVVKGTMGLLLNGVNTVALNKNTVALGQEVSVPPGSRHFFYNAGDATSDLQLRITLTPALAARQFFETLPGLGHDYGSLDKVPPLQMLLTFAEGGVDLALPAPARLLIRLLAVPFARGVGYRAFYPEYTP